MLPGFGLRLPYSPTVPFAETPVQVPEQEVGAAEETRVSDYLIEGEGPR